VAPSFVAGEPILANRLPSPETFAEKSWREKSNRKIAYPVLIEKVFSFGFPFGP
jgi:hypothetical protein